LPLYGRKSQGDCPGHRETHRETDLALPLYRQTHNKKVRSSLLIRLEPLFQCLSLLSRSFWIRNVITVPLRVVTRTPKTAVWAGISHLSGKEHTGEGGKPPSPPPPAASGLRPDGLRVASLLGRGDRPGEGAARPPSGPGGSGCSCQDI